MAELSPLGLVVGVEELAAILVGSLHKKVVLDARPFLDFNANHVINSVNVGCSKLLKRRLQNDKMHVTEFLAQNFRVEIDSDFDIFVYDQSSSSFSCLATDSCLGVLLQKLSVIAKSISLLKGGFVEFETSFPELCVNKMRCPSSSSDASLPLLLHPQHHSISQPCLPVANVGPTKILPFLFLGSQVDALCAETMTQNGIGYVLNVSLGEKPEFIQERHFLRIPVNDNHSDKLLPFFKEAFQFLDKIREGNGRVLVHCLAGISRSPTVVIAYVMRALNMNMESAYRYIKEKRPTISPNFNFLGQLVEYEKQQQQQQQQSSQNASTKPSPHHSSGVCRRRQSSALSTPSSSSSCQLSVNSPTQTMARLSFGSLSPLTECPSSSSPSAEHPPFPSGPPVPFSFATKSSGGHASRMHSTGHEKEEDDVKKREGGPDDTSRASSSCVIRRPKSIAFAPSVFHSVELNLMTTEPRPRQLLLGTSTNNFLSADPPLSAEVLVMDTRILNKTDDSADSEESVHPTPEVADVDDYLEPPVWKRRRSRSMEDIVAHVGAASEAWEANRRKRPPARIRTNKVGFIIGRMGCKFQRQTLGGVAALGDDVIKADGLIELISVS